MRDERQSRPLARRKEVTLVDNVWRPIRVNHLNELAGLPHWSKDNEMAMLSLSNEYNHRAIDGARI